MLAIGDIDLLERGDGDLSLTQTESYACHAKRKADPPGSIG